MDCSHLSFSVGTVYTDPLKEFSKKNPTFAASVEKAFSDLVQTAQMVSDISIGIQLNGKYKRSIELEEKETTSTDQL